MKPVIVPIAEVNNTEFFVADWNVADGAEVKAGQLLGHVETAKAIYDIAAPADGVIGIVVQASQTAEFNKPVAYLFDTANALEGWRGQQTAVASAPNSMATLNVTAPAADLAAKHGIILAAIDSGGRLITKKRVEAEIERRAVQQAAPSLAPQNTPAGRQRLALIGAGRGASQVLDILANNQEQAAVALFDDDPATWGKIVYSLPVCGGMTRLKELFEAGAFSAAIVTISTSVAVRAKFRSMCASLGLPLANAIDPSCRISKDAKLGLGNVINPFSYIGPHTIIGDNNFFSAFNSIDHHCVVGSDISTGPGFVVSGIVRIGDRVRAGTGVFVQPYLEIGSDVQIASGATIVGNIPAKHAVKTKTITTQIAPIH